MGIGAHTRTHPILASLDAAAARDEIATGRSELEAIAGVPVPLFAYPNGKPGTDYTARDVTLVRELGFAAAVTTAPGVATRRADVWQLPRFTPWDRPLWKFGTRLSLNLWQLHHEVA
jgi:peptidoglycan/xylan/chitin deacetylase (PgdA/CDA1 family)